MHHACARERFGNQNRWKTRAREHFWKLKSPKFVSRLRAKAIWKSKSLKLEGFGALLEVELRKICTTSARESDSEVKIVKVPGSWDFFEVQNIFRVAGAGNLIKIAKMYCNSEVKRLLNMSYFREVPSNQSVSYPVS